MKKETPFPFAIYPSFGKAWGPFSILASLWAARSRIRSTKSAIEKIKELQKITNRTPAQQAELTAAMNTEAVNRAVHAMLQTKTRRGPRRGAVEPAAEPTAEPVTEPVAESIEKPAPAPRSLPDWMQAPIRRGAPLDAVRNLGQSDIVSDAAPSSPTAPPPTSSSPTKNPLDPLIEYAQTILAKPVTRAGAISNTLAAGAAAENMDMKQFVPQEVAQLQPAVAAVRQVDTRAAQQRRNDQVFVLDGLQRIYSSGKRALRNVGVMPDGTLVMILPGNERITRASVQGAQTIQEAEENSLGNIYDLRIQEDTKNTRSEDEHIFHASPKETLLNSNFWLSAVLSKERGAAESESPSMEKTVLETLAPVLGSLRSALKLPRGQGGGIFGHIGRRNAGGLPGVQLVPIGNVPRELIDPQTGLLKFAPTAKLSSTLFEISSETSDWPDTAEAVQDMRYGDPETYETLLQLKKDTTAYVGKNLLESLSASGLRDAVRFDTGADNYISNSMTEWHWEPDEGHSQPINNLTSSIINRIGIDSIAGDATDAEAIASLARGASVGGRASILRGDILVPMTASFDQNSRNQKAAFEMIPAEIQKVTAVGKLLLRKMRDAHTQIVAARETHVIQSLIAEHPEISPEAARQLITQPFKSEKFFSTTTGVDGDVYEALDMYDGLEDHIQAMKNAGQLPQTVSSEKLTGTIRESAKDWTTSPSRQKTLDAIARGFEVLGREPKGFMKPTTLHSPQATKEEKLSVNQSRMPLYKEKEMKEPMELSLTDVFYGLRKSPDFLAAESTPPPKKLPVGPSKAVLARKESVAELGRQAKGRIAGIQEGGRELADKVFPLSPRQQALADEYAASRKAQHAFAEGLKTQEPIADVSESTQKHYAAYEAAAADLESNHFEQMANAMLLGKSEEEQQELALAHAKEIEHLKRMHGFGQGSMDVGTALGPKSMAFPFQLKHVIRKLPGHLEHRF